MKDTTILILGAAGVATAFFLSRRSVTTTGGANPPAKVPAGESTRDRIERDALDYAEQLATGLIDGALSRIRSSGDTRTAAQFSPGGAYEGWT